ncbi:hypothetical protein BC829DRAFT_390748 [Chytridium lagenaria]|nr:hypothetical protein BC829DRAFT_390748 [Chytridium lagenaria]
MSISLSLTLPLVKQIVIVGGVPAPVKAEVSQPAAGAAVAAVASPAVGATSTRSNGSFQIHRRWNYGEIVDISVTRILSLKYVMWIKLCIVKNCEYESFQL